MERGLLPPHTESYAVGILVGFFCCSSVLEIMIWASPPAETSK